MELNMVSLTNQSTSRTIEVPDVLFSAPYNEPLIHQVVTAYMNAARQGSKAQKTRAEVRGGGAKPWKQKGTGRARAGTIRSPIWRKGGVTFAATPRSYAQKVNKKMYRGAIRSIFSEMARTGVLKVVDAFDISEPKTKKGLQLMQTLNVTGRVLLIDDVINEALWLSIRNLHQIFLLTPDAIDPVTLVHVDHVVITEKALRLMIEGGSE